MTRLRPILAVWVMAFCLLGAASAEAVTLPPGFQDEPVLEADEPGFEQTTTFKFAPDGRIFVATKGGKILVYPPGTRKASEATVFANLAKQTYDYGDHGLLGLALDPRFEDGRPYVYALYSYNHELGAPVFAMPRFPSVGTGVSAYEGDECPVENECIVSGRLVRLTADGNHAVGTAGGGEADEDVLLEEWCQQSSSHSIGDLAFGPEGALFVSGGDGALFDNADYGQYKNLCGDPPGTKGSDMPLTPDAAGGALRSQSLLRANGPVLLNGTIDRIDPDTGEGWPGNPEAASADANARRIIAFGYRNPFRFVVNPRLGDIFVGNVGMNVWEEIDRVTIGSGQLWNSGWPCREGPWRVYEYEVLGLDVCEGIYEYEIPTEEPFFAYMHTEPVVSGEECSRANGSAISGQAFYEGSTYPAEYDDALFFADSVRGCIYVMPADGAGEPDPASVRPFLSTDVSDYPGVDVEQGPDGSIYYTTLDDGKVNRIAYDPAAVRARLTTIGDPWGYAPLTVRFDAGGSTLPAGHTAGYEWDLDGDGEFDDGSGATQQFEYTDGTKNVEVGVRVKDLATDNSSIAHLTVYPGDSPPQVTIAEPAASLTWSVGQSLHFKGSAVAQEQKGATPLPAADLNWKARLLHCPHDPLNCHEHPIQEFSGVAEGAIGAPDHSYPAYVNFLLEATDARGLSSETSVKVAPRAVTMQIRSEPPGIEIGIGESKVTTPGEYTVIEGSRTSVAAPQAAMVGGTTYTFQGWSDGGARVHDLPATVPGTYTAIYAAAGGPPASGGEGGGGNSGGGRGGGVEPVQPVPEKPRLKARPPKQTRSTTARFAFGGSAGAGFQCKLDRGRFVACHSPRIYRKLKPGRHTLRVVATDGGGGRSAATVFSWKIVPGA